MTEPYKAVGFRAGSIGVRETKSESFCNQIDTTSPIFTPQIAETLVLALPATLTDDFGPLVADAASLDVELRSSNSRILATASLAGNPVAYYELNTGTFQNATPLISGTTPIVTKSASTSPGNVQWNIGSADDVITFDTLSIRAYRGAISLEGGGDGGTAKPTTIDLLGTAEEKLACGESVDETGTGVVSGITVRRLTPTDSTSCEAFDVVLTVDGDTFTFRKPLDRDLDAEFILDYTWDVPLGENTTVDGVVTPAPRPDYASYLDFEVPEGRGEFELGFCALPIVENGILLGVDPHQSIVDLETVDGVQYACIGVSTTEVGEKDGKPVLKVAEQVYVVGDLRGRVT